MRQPILFASLLCVGLLGTSYADEAAVKQMIDEYASAFNSKNVDAAIGFWSEDAVHIDRETNLRTEGRDAIKADLAASFEQSPDSKIFGRILSLRFVRPDVVSVDGEVTASTPGEDPSQTLFSAILVEEGGKWLINTIEESPVTNPSSNYEALAELEWLIGRWVDQGQESRVDTTFRWTANNAFLLRSFAVSTAAGVELEGTQVIGWDPRSGEIRSWSFQSDGSFGDATWSRNGDDWMIKSSQTLADGQAASGTFIYTRINDDEVSVQLIGHEVEGEPQPAGAAITLQRVVEEAPAADAAVDAEASN
jgi:uncharacterized protein (TIGR02246 family)